MRRLLALVSVVVFADTMLFSAIIPLLPGLSDEYGLSKLQSGLLVGAYGAGAMIAGIPSGLLASRIGPKRMVVLGLLFLAASTIAFSFGSSAPELAVARLGQGIASSATWAGALAWLTLTAPRSRRGQILGTAFSFAILGFIVGPAVGALARLTSVEATFVVIGLAAVVLAAAASTFAAGPTDVRRPGALRRGLRDVGFLAAIWITLVPALFFGMLDVLVPLALDADGWGAVAIAATFIAAGLAEVGLAPMVGKLSDSRGRLYPIRVALVLLTAIAIGFATVTPAALVALLVFAASLAASGIYTPGIALVSDRAEETHLPQTLGFGLMNTSWAIGAMVGPAAGGALAQAIGDPAPYAVCAVLAAATVFLVSRAAGPTPQAA